MKSVKKLTVAGLIVALAGAIVATVGACLGGASPELKYEQATYEQQSAQISSVALSAAAGRIKTEFYGGDKIEIDYPKSDYLKTDISEQGGVLKLNFGLWWWSFLNNYDIPPVTVKLPAGNIYDIEISLSAGVLNVSDGVYGNMNLTMSAGVAEFGKVKCEKLALKMSAGVTEFDVLECGLAEFDLSAGTASPKSLNCPHISVDLSAGKFGCGIVGKEEDYDISADVSAGSCSLSSRLGNGSGKTLDIDVSAGSADIYFTGA